MVLDASTWQDKHNEYVMDPNEVLQKYMHRNVQLGFAVNSISTLTSSVECEGPSSNPPPPCSLSPSPPHRMQTGSASADKHTMGSTVLLSKTFNDCGI